MPITSITYTPHPNDNTLAIKEFVGGFPVCEDCDDSGEYEGEYGPVGCNPCNSRLLPFLDKHGKRLFADWDDEIVKDADGNLSLVQNHLND